MCSVNPSPSHIRLPCKSMFPPISTPASVLTRPLCVFQKQTLMQHVLRCDYEACRQYLVNLEQAFLLDQGSQALGALLDHRCDGNRNILHAAVSVCFPVSNKETKEEEGKLAFFGCNLSGCP